MTREQFAKFIESTMQSFESARSDSSAPNCAGSRTQARRAAPVEGQTKGATLIVAGPFAESHERWMCALCEAFAVCEVNERRALEQVMSSLRPDVLVVDLALHGMHRVRGLRDIQRLNPATKIIALSDAPTEDEGLLALKAGAKGYCGRAMEPGEVMKAVAAVQNGEIWASRKLVRALVGELVSLVDSRKREGKMPKLDPRLESLTERQRIVADLISRGASNKEIGNRLNISERTVKAHLTEAFRHVGVSDRLQLALLFQRREHAPGDD